MRRIIDEQYERVKRLLAERESLAPRRSEEVARSRGDQRGGSQGHYGKNKSAMPTICRRPRAEHVVVQTERSDVDCRYIDTPKSVNHPDQEKATWENVFLPDGDVFRPLMADLMRIG